MPSASLALYRALVPAHVAVLDATVERWLELAAQRHTAAAFGAVYAQAMVWWAAHQIERLPGSGAGGGSASEVGPIVSQSDGDLSRSYAPPAAPSSGSSAVDANLGTTRYGQLYLELRGSRAATSPMAVPA